MDQKTNQLESIFRSACDKQTLTPSARVLRKLKTRLWIADYFSFNPRKFNVAYTTLILAGIGSAIFLTRSSENTSDVLTENQAPVVQKGQDITDKESDVSRIDPSIEMAIPEAKENTSGTLLEARFGTTSNKGCAPLTIRFTNQSTASSSYQWNFGTGDRSGEKNPVYSYSKPGHYTASLTVQNSSGQKNTYEQKIEVLEKPLADFEIDIENSEINRKKIVLKNKSTGGANYTWDFGDGHQIQGSTASHTYADFGVYKVSLISEAASGCSDTATILNKFIERNYELSFPLNFRPDLLQRNDGFYGQAGTLTSIFYPKNFGAEKYELNIFAPNGLNIFSTNTIKQGWNGYIGARVAPAGMYSWEASGIYPNGKPFHLKGSVKVIVQEYD